MTGLRVRQGSRVGVVVAVYRYTAVVQWEKDPDRDVVWLYDLLEVDDG